MCSELLRIPIVWNGVPVFGFGLVLLIWLGVGGWIMFVTAKQGGWPASLKTHLPTVLIVAALIAVGVPRFVPGGVPLRSYGILMLVGIVAGIWLAIHRAVEAGLEIDDMLGLALWVIPCGAIGGRLFYVIEYWTERIRTPDLWGTLKNALAFTEGGLVVYGAFAGAMAGFAIYVAKHKLPALALADLIAPSMMVGLAFGRIGCLMNGCCYGGESNAPWAITFPRENSPNSLSGPYAEQASEGRFYGLRVGERPGEPNAVVVEQVDAGSPAADAGLKVGDVITAIDGGSIADVDAAHFRILDALIKGRSLTLTTPAGVRTLPAVTAPPRSLPVHPAQIYSSIDAALLGWVLWSYYPFRRRDGEVIALMLMLHPISRFMLEAIRVDEAPVWGTGLSISQNLSAGLFAIGLGLWLFARRNSAQRLAFPLLTAAGSEPKLAPVR
jgi:phosphatidylglycerol:prolipoprotein diacylglycerol transferase